MSDSTQSESLFKCGKCGGATIKVSHRNHPFCTVCARCPCARCETKDRGSARGMNEACAKLADKEASANEGYRETARAGDRDRADEQYTAFMVASRIATEIRLIDPSTLSPSADAGEVARLIDRCAAVEASWRNPDCDDCERAGGACSRHRVEALSRSAGAVAREEVEALFAECETTLAAALLYVPTSRKGARGRIVDLLARLDAARKAGRP